MRALVLGTARSRGALAGARALGRAGWEVAVGTPGPGPVTASKFVSKAHRVPVPSQDPDGFDAAVETATASGYDVVFAAGDDWLIALTRLAPRLEGVVAHPREDVVTRALDKVELARLAEVSGLSSPRTVVATAELLAGWTGPALVKPRCHWVPGRVQPGRAETRAAVTPSDIARATQEIEAVAGTAILQQPVAGNLVAFSGVFDGKGLVARVQQKAEAVFPVPAGISSRAVTVPIDDALADHVTHLLRGLDWAGIFQVQFIDDGTTKWLIDFNGRFYGSMALAEAAGVNLPAIAADVALGRPVAGGDAVARARYVRLPADLRRAMQERRGGRSRDVARSLRWAVGAAHSLWDPADPAPVIEPLLRGLRRRFGR